MCAESVLWCVSVAVLILILMLVSKHLLKWDSAPTTQQHGDYLPSLFVRLNSAILPEIRK